MPGSIIVLAISTVEGNNSATRVVLPETKTANETESLALAGALFAVAL